jgi:hypothetical protein
MPYSIEQRNNFLKLTFPTGAGVDKDGNRLRFQVNSPNTVWLGLCKNDPTELVEGVRSFEELSCDTYARVPLAQIGNTLVNIMSDVADGKIYNVADIQFPTANAQWDDVNGIGLFTTATEGEPMFYAKLPETKRVEADEILTFKPETFVMQFADEDLEISANPVSV